MTFVTCIYFLIKMSTEFLSNFSDLCQDQMVGWGFFVLFCFVFLPVNVVKYTDPSLNAKILLHTWNKPYLIVLYYAFKIYGWIQLANILLRTFGCTSMRKIGE